jgi:hypothetical protein
MRIVEPVNEFVVKRLEQDSGWAEHQFLYR